MDSMSFEKAMERLEDVVRLLERGDTPLDQSLKLFEEGTTLIRSCGKMLEEAEQVVVRLMKGSEGEPVETGFLCDEQ